VVGTYGAFGSRFLIVRDLEIAKHVLVKDFDHFVDRRPVELSKKANKYIGGMLTTMTGEKWKTMRSIMSPVFTSGKLRSMMPTIHKVFY
jgi:cytochrome P450 family 9